MARTRYPAWPGNIPGHKLQGRLYGKKSRGGGRQSDIDGDKSSVPDQKRDYGICVEEDGYVDCGWFADEDSPAGDGAPPRPEMIADLERVRANQSLPEDEREHIRWWKNPPRMTRGDYNIFDLLEQYALGGFVLSIDGQIFNPRYERDKIELARLYNEARAKRQDMVEYTEANRERTAREGQPGPRVVYGYTRVYEPSPGRRKIYHDEPDLDGRIIEPGAPEWDGSGPDWDGDAIAPACVVQQIYWWVGGGQTVHWVSIELERLRIPRPWAGRGGKSGRYAWHPHSVRLIASNPFYYGAKVYSRTDSRAAGRAARQASVIELDEGAKIWWTPLITRDQFDAAQDALDSRIRPRSSKPRNGESGLKFHQSTSVIVCDVCDTPLSTGESGHGDEVPYIRCSKRGCVAAKENLLDDEVSARMILWSCRKDVRADLRKYQATDTTVTAGHRAEVTRLRKAIADAQAVLDNPGPDDDIIEVARGIKGLRRQLDAALSKSWPSSLPPWLPGLLDAGKKGAAAAETHWAGLSVPARKGIIAFTADIRLAKGDGKRHYNAHGERAFDQKRLKWKWRTGPDPDLDVRADPDLGPDDTEDAEAEAG